METSKKPSFWWEKSEKLYREWVETKSKEVWKDYIDSLKTYYKVSWGEIM